jgi:hypothetical protein
MAQFDGKSNLVGYYNTPYKAKYDSSSPDNSHLLESINSSQIADTHNGKIQVGGKHIWSHLSASSEHGPYSNMSTDSQRHIESFMDFSKSAKTKGFLALDIETLGNASTGSHFHVTEIAVSGIKHLKGSTFADAKTLSMAMVLKPNESVQKNYQHLIDGVAGGADFSKLHIDDQRSLIDLMRYSTAHGDGLHGAQFDKSGSVIHSNVLNHFGLNTKSLNHNVIHHNQSHFAIHMHSGLHNLSKHGIHHRKAFRKLNRMFHHSNRHHKFLFTKNGDVFDIPALHKFAALNGETLINPEHHLDWYQLQKTVFPDPVAMHEVFGRNLNALDENSISLGHFIEGQFSLFEDRRTLGLGNDAAHAALADTNMHGLGGVIASTYTTIAEQLQAGKVGFVPQAGLVRATPLSWSDEALHQGQILFAPSGIVNYKGAKFDFQAEFDPEAQRYTAFQPGFNKTVINAESFYQVKGVRQLEGTQVALELMNTETERSSFIVRDGPNARTQLAEFVQRSFTTANNVDPATQAKIAELTMQDRARRRYNGLFNLDQGTTKGFSAAKRMYGNAAAIAANQPLNFNSLWNGKEWVHNADEAAQFNHMLPRLSSELEIFQAAIHNIDTAIPGNTTSDLYKKSIALQDFSRRVNANVGSHQATRDRLEHERVLNFNDRLSNGSSHTINMQSVDSAMRSMTNYIYADHDKYSDKALQRQVADERYKTLLVNLNEAGHLNQDQIYGAEGYLATYMGRNQATSVSVKQLVLDLMANNQIEQAQITSESLEKRAALAAINMQTANALIQDSVNHGINTRGYMKSTSAGSIPDINNHATVNEMLNNLDRTHDITMLEPNHRKALDNIMRELASHTRTMDLNTAITMAEDGSAIHLNIFDQNHSISVLNQLNQGEAAVNAARITLPTIQSNGMMVMGNQELNARTYLIHDSEAEANRMISSVEKIAMGYVNMIRSNLPDSFVNKLAQGDFAEAQSKMDWMLKKQTQDLSGRKRNLGSPSDSFAWQDNLSDIQKQASVHVAPQAINDMVNQNLLRLADVPQFDPLGKSKKALPSHFKDSAFVNGRLSPFVSFTDMTAEGADLARRLLPGWAAGSGLNLSISGVKSDRFIKGDMSRLDTRAFTPYADYTVQGRDNGVQMNNMYPIEKHIQDGLKNQRAIFATTEEMTTTPLMKQMMARIGTDNPMEVHVKAAFMTDIELQNRITAMMGNDQGRALLSKEGILGADGTIDPIRRPTLYEQQSVMAREFTDQFKVTEQKFINVPEGMQWHGRFVAADKSLNMLGGLNPETVIGSFNDKDITLAGLGFRGQNAQMFEKDGRLGLRFQEQVHKYFLDYEKVTPAGGASGYSAEFIQAITGVHGASVIYNPDILKHKDVSALMRAQANKVLDYINNEIIPADRAAKIDMINKASIGIAASMENGKANFLYTGGKGISYSSFSNVLSDLGISESAQVNGFGLDGRSTVNGIQGVRAAQVRQNDRAINEIMRADGTIDGVRYGHRELDIFRRRGAHSVVENIIGQMMNDASDTGSLNESQGMINSIRSATRNIDPNGEIKEFSVNDFKPLPITEQNKATLARTILDTDYIRKQMGPEAAKHNGFFLKLPGQGVEVEGKATDRIFLPLIEQQGKGNDIWKKELQRHIANIFKRSAAVDAMKAADGAEAMTFANNHLFEAVNEYHSHLLSDVTSSNGALFENVLKVNMPNSASGILKIVPPEASRALNGEFTFISPNDAKAMGIAEHLIDGHDFYVPNLRYPSFHSDAIQVSKLAISEHVADGQHHVTSLIASAYGGDSDGDYNHIVAMKNARDQADLKMMYDNQITDRANRHAHAWEAATANASEWDAAHDIEFKKYAESEHLRFDMASFTDAEGNFIQYAANSQEEVAAKSGKAIVGMASDVNYQLRQIANQYISDPAQRIHVEEFGRNLEQKLISAKHTTDLGGVDFRRKSGSLAFIEALQGGNWKGAIDVDSQYQLGFGELSPEGGPSKYRLLETASIMENLQNQIKGYRDGSLRAGLSSGLRMSLADAGDILEGNRSQSYGTTPIHLLQRVSGVADESDYLDLINQVDHGATSGFAVNEIQLPNPSTIVTPGENGTTWTNQMDVPLDGQNRPITYAERGLGRIGAELHDFIHSQTGKATGIIGAAALGGLFLFNAMGGGGPSMLPENRASHPDNDLQTHHAGSEMPQQQQTTRLESNEGAMNGLRVQVRGRSPGHLTSHDIGGMAGDAVMNAGIPTKVNVRAQDDTSTIDRSWLTNQFASVMSNGYTNG